VTSRVIVKSRLEPPDAFGEMPDLLDKPIDAAAEVEEHPENGGSEQSHEGPDLGLHVNPERSTPR
jgi:hypothetical protein